MIIDVCLIIIAACMVIFVIIALVAAIILLKDLNRTLSSLHGLTQSVKEKVDATEPVFGSISKIGQISESFLNNSVKEHHQEQIVNGFEKEKFDAAAVAEWIGLSVMLWQKLKKRISS